MTPPKGPSEVLLEFVRIGGQMRVSAIDSATGIEVVIIAPHNAPRAQVQQIALAKLKRKMESEGKPTPR